MGRYNKASNNPEKATFENKEEEELPAEEKENEKPVGQEVDITKNDTEEEDETSTGNLFFGSSEVGEDDFENNTEKN